MEGIWAILLAVAAGIVSWPACMLGLTAARVRRLRLREGAVHAIARDALPPLEAQVLDGARGLLQELGFALQGSFAIRGVIEVAGKPLLHSDRYRHADGRTHAIVTPSASPEQGEPCTIVFESLLADGTLVMTSDCFAHALAAMPANWRVHDDYLGDLRAAWQAHQQRLAGAAVDTDAAAFDAASRRAVEGMRAELERGGHAVPHGDGARFTWRYALAFTWRLWRGQRRVARVRAGRPAAAAGAGSLQADVHAFEQQLGMQRAGQGSAARKWFWFLATAVLFLAVGQAWFGVSFVLALLAVIALHEGGHYLAMRAARYRNLAVFFLPGLGGLATGEKASAGPWEKLAVYLAGPLPGLLLGAAGLAAMLAGAWQPPAWMRTFLVVCVVLNYINLLPVTPLDGGRIVEALLFARLPAARFAFALAGCAALLAYGTAARDHVALAIGAVIGLTLPHQWRVMRVDRAVERHGDEVLDEPQAVRRVFAALQQPAFARWPFPVRSAAALALLPELQGRRPRRVEAAAGLAIYLACLAGPPLAFALAWPQETASAREAVVAGLFGRAPPAGCVDCGRDWHAEAARVEELPQEQRLGVLLQAATQASDEEDEARLRRYLAAAWALAQQRPAGDVERARTLLARAGAADEPKAMGALLEQLVAEQAGTQERAGQLVLAEAREMQSWLAEGAARADLLRHAVAHREQAGEGGSPATAGVRLHLARALDAAGRADEAEVVLRQNIAAVPAPPAGDRSPAALRDGARRLAAEVELAWFLVDHGRGAEAAALVQQGLARGQHPAAAHLWDVEARAQEAFAWAALRQAGEPGPRAGWQAYAPALRRLVDARPGALPHLLDAWVLSQAAQDGATQARMREQVAQALARGVHAGMRKLVCEGEALRPAGFDDWRGTQLRARSDAARALGVCG